MKLTRFKLAFLSYAIFDLLIGGHCGGLLPLGLSAAAQTTPAYGNITATSSSCLTTNCVSIQLDGSTGAATIQLTGTFVATVSFEASNDNGTTWVAINGTPPNSTTAVSSATATGLWQFNVAGFTNLRARGSAYTSGTAAAVINSAHASAKASGGGAVFASGGTTNNVIPKSNGSSQLADSSLTDNGTVVTSTEPIVIPDSNTAGGLLTSGNTAQGIAIKSAGSGPQIWFINSGARRTFGIDTSGSTVNLAANTVLGWNSSATDPGGTGIDTALTRGASGVVAVGTGAAANAAGTVNLATMQYRGLAQTTFVTGDFTTSGSGTALEAITGLTWTFPATTAINARIDCNILYSQAVANAAVAFGFQDASVAPTNLAASGIQYTSATASTEGTLAASATTTATAVTTATPSAITTIWHTQLHFLVEQPSNASTSVFTIRVSTATTADLVTVKRGSYCSLAQ